MIQFFNDPQDITWLTETHLRNWGEASKVRSAVLEGNEDYPTRLTVFEDIAPLYTDKPLATLVPDDIRGWDIPHKV